MSFLQQWRLVAVRGLNAHPAGSSATLRSSTPAAIVHKWSRRSSAYYYSANRTPRVTSGLIQTSKNRLASGIVSAAYATSAPRPSRPVRSKNLSSLTKKRVTKKRQETDNDEFEPQGWFGIVRGDVAEDEGYDMAEVAARKAQEPAVKRREREEPLSEWELPESPGSRQVLQFDSPLRGNYSDLSAPMVPIEEMKSEMMDQGGKQTLKALKFDPTKIGTRGREVVEEVDEIRALLSEEGPAIGKVDLGLTETSKRVLARANSGKPTDVVEEYLAAENMSEREMFAAKHDILPVPPLGSWEAEHLAARRVAEILTMPVYGPGPIYKGRNPALWTYEESEYFDKYPRTAKNYNKFIWSLCKLGQYEKARAALAAMAANRVPRDVGVYTSLMQGCIIRKDPREAMRVFVEMRKEGIAPDLWVFDTLMEVFVTSGELDGAFALYDELKGHGLKPTTIIFTTLVKGCIKEKDLERAWKVFEHMRVWHCEPDEVMFNLMIHACALNSETERAFTLYDQMKQAHIRPTHVTFNSLLYACARRKDYYAQAWDLLKTMKIEGYIPEYRTFDLLLAVAAKGGDIQTAELLFDEAISAPGPLREQPYAFMMEGYAMTHRVHAEQHNRKKYVASAEALFDRMVAAGIKPTNLSANLRLNVYTFNSLISRAVEWKKTMKEVYNVTPDVYTYNALIEMYGRVRKMDLALDQFNLMKAEGLTPGFATYGVLIEGCTRNHFVTTGMKLLREMKAKNIEITPEHTFIINFRRGLVKTPDLVREIDQLTGKAYRFVMPWRRKGSIKKVTYHRELTKEEAKRTSLYG